MEKNNNLHQNSAFSGKELPDDRLNGEAGPQTYVSQINARTKIVEILSKVETRQSYTDKLLERELDEFSDTDRGLITEVVNGVLRWQYRLDWYLSQLYVGEYENLIPDVKNNLRAALYQLMYLEKIPPYAVLNEAVEITKTKYNQKSANLVNAILRNYLRQYKKLEFLEKELDVLDRLAVRYSHPRWLIQRWVEHWGIDEVTQLCQCNNSRPRISVRINLLQADPEPFFKSLEENGIPYEVHPDFRDFIWIDDFSEFRKLAFLKKGWVTVQDVSTALPVLILDPRPGEKVLDMCAAPGGKSAFIAQQMKNDGLLISMERYIGRARLLKDNLERVGVKNGLIVNGDGLRIPFSFKFNRILLDAPCTGFGVLNKRVDLKWKRTEQDIYSMQQIQLQLLESAAEAVQAHGVIVFSTCTIEPEENEQVVERFLELHPDFELENLKGFIPDKYLWDKYYIRTFPQRHQMDGSFAARLRKRPI